MVGSIGPSLQRRSNAAAHKLAAAAAQARKGGSIAFGGSQYLTLGNDSDLNMSSGDFTIQGWVRVTSLATNQTIADWRPSATNGAYQTFYIDTLGKLTYYTNGAVLVAGTRTIATNAWVHVAWSRNGGTIRQFVNGQLDAGGTFTDTGVYNSGFLSIGVNSNAASNYFNGAITGFQVVKGLGMYPTTAFGLPNTPTVPNANTKLLLNAITSATFLTDLSGLNKTVTNHGTTWSSLEPF